MMIQAITTGGGVNMPFGILAAWQAPDAINSGHAILLEIFIGIAALALLAQAVAVVGLAVGLMKAQKVIMGHVVEIKGKVMPLVEKSQALITDLTPEIKQVAAKVFEITAKVNEITAHVEVIAGVAKDKVQEFAPTISAANVTFGEANQTVKDANQKTRQQISRVNGMISSTLDATASLGKAIQHGISLPGRELSGLINGAKATIDSLLHKAKGAGGGGRSKAAAPTVAWPGTPRTQTPGAGMPLRPITSQGVPDVNSSAEVSAATAAAAFRRAE